MLRTKKKFLSTLLLLAALACAACVACALPSPAPSVSRQSSSLPSTLSSGTSEAGKTPRASGGGTKGRTPGTKGTGAQQPSGDASDATQALSLDVPAHPADVILGSPTANSITASVLAYQAAQGYLEYGTQSGVYANKTPVTSLAVGQPVEIRLETLQADTQYFFRFSYQSGGSSGFTALSERTFRTQPPPGTTFTFDVQADSHLDSNSDLDVYARALQNELADAPDFLIDLGDTFMTNKYQSYTSAEDQYLAQRYFLGALAPSPLFLALGNHDGEGASGGRSATEMVAWSTELRTRLFPNPHPDGFYSGNTTSEGALGLPRDYYAWKWGDALFVVLDPYRFTAQQSGTTGNWDRTLGDAQYQWLKRTLETSDATWKFVFIHQLVGGLDTAGRGGIGAAGFFEWGGNNADGSSGFAAERPGWPLPIHQLLVANKVSAVFHGHDHLFVREELDGIVYQEVPQPSAARSGTTNSAKEYGYLTGDVLGSSGHVRVTVSSTQVTVDYVRAYLPQAEGAQQTNGETAYTYTIGR